MATTFSALCEQADWSVPEVVKKEEPEQPKKEEGEMKSDTTNPEAKISVDLPQISTDRNLELHYNIQLILPPSTNPAVFDALFSSLRKHFG